MHPEPNRDGAAPQAESGPFEVRPAARLGRLPPYLFGRINGILYAKRRRGDDVIDLGMGNPTDPPEDQVIDKLAEAARDPGAHRYSKSAGLLNLRKEIAAKYMRKYGVRFDPESETIACLGSKEGFSHMCLAMMGPGDTAIVPDPYFPIHVYAVVLASGNVITLEVADSGEIPQQHRLHVPAPHADAEAADSQLPPQPLDPVR